MRKRTTSRWLDAVPVRATGVDARGPGLRGPTAAGALAVGATAVGAVAIGRLAIGHASIKRLVIDDLVVRRMQVAEGQPELGGDPAERARRLIETQTVMTVGTADATGRPSVSPVAFVHDDDFNLYWVSSRTAAHSDNIRTRPEVAIAVFASEPQDGVYVDGTATELEDQAEIERAIALLNRRTQPSKFDIGGPGDVTGDAAWRIYKATRVETTVRTDSTERGQAVTIRTPVAL
jgi:nitroimidazol reductase NimA-like FMN-containing flavoprotein (pyridoxamine 5'-phosphate oxidase superfamily)